MIDFGIDKLALIGAVALIVIGPEKLPRVARTVGVLLGKAQRYIAQVQGEVNRSMQLEELRKMHSDISAAGASIQRSVHNSMSELNQHLSNSSAGDEGLAQAKWEPPSPHGSFYADLPQPGSPLRRARKNWRLKRGATPLWYKQRQGIRRHVQSGAARVARYRPPRTW